MSEIKGTLLTIVLSIMVFGAVAGILTANFEAVATNVGEQAVAAVSTSSGE